MSATRMNYSIKHTLPFTQKMNSVAVISLMVMAVISAPVVGVFASQHLLSMTVAASTVLGMLTWFYLTAILFQFYRRTGLREYILRIHTYWLAGVLAYPLILLLGSLLLLFRSAMPPLLYTFFGVVIPAMWLVFAVAGKRLGQRRTKQMNAEIQGNAALWQSLLSMDWKDIALLRFPVKH